MARRIHSKAGKDNWQDVKAAETREKEELSDVSPDLPPDLDGLLTNTKQEIGKMLMR